MSTISVFEISNRNFQNFAPHQNVHISPETFGFLQIFVNLVKFYSNPFKISQNFKKFRTKKFRDFRNFGSIAPPRQKP